MPPSSDPDPTPPDPTSCSIIGAADALGDVWSILVLRELFLGVRRFNDIQSDLGISRSVLTDRLAHLAEIGVVRAVPYQQPGERPRNEYRLTRKGVGLLPLIVALKTWGDEHVNHGTQTVRLQDRDSGEEVRLEFRTTSGTPVEPNQIEAKELIAVSAVRPARSRGRG